MLATSKRWMNVGRLPVGFVGPTILPFSIPVCWKVTMSWGTIPSPSMPCTSVTAVVFQVSSLRRSCWTIKSTVEAIYCRMTVTDRSMPAMRHIVSRLERVWRGLLA